MQVSGAMNVRKITPQKRVMRRDALDWSALANLTPTDWAYIAGIIDGEGTITVQVRTRQVSTTHKPTTVMRPTVVVTNTSWLLLQYLEKLGLGWVLRTNNANKKFFTIQVSGWGIGPLLVGMLPYLVIKKQLAEWMLELLSIRDTMPFRLTFSPRMFEIAELIKDTNTRGSRLQDDLRRNNVSMTSLPRLSALKLEG
jgi:hypothetical protein